ncbi:T9SS sorting signal type C domain-containing protein [Flavobacterium piscinae]|uniref:T9SS sorting signal type C domain-containing protein n=1 Tax=Flavobacterium piscinae TaxID=2506424 RepID=UPI0019B12A67|nr:T9SS sorting signal type C domain-containing protein [Flavobacterium piscinae]MBC8884220.1 T9SS sorting signal type C domain-containing protein [Flavobacterium piscinae]
MNPNVPTGNIAAGQGFFVQGLASGTLNFDNSMRLTGLNDLFYRSPDAPQISVVEKHRIWLNIINQQGAYKQMLLGYVQGATNELDNAYDAEVTEAGNVVSLYSLNSNKKLTIQGRALPFNVSDEIPLGFRTTIAGDFAIELENFDGLFEEGQQVYLEDKWLNVIHNLNTANYNFTTEAGTFDDRFEVQFEDGTLSVNNPDVSNAIVVYKNNQTIFVNSGNIEMKEVRLFDVRGRLITDQSSINATTVQFVDLNIANQVILVQITTTEGQIVTKKVAY